MAALNSTGGHPTTRRVEDPTIFPTDIRAFALLTMARAALLRVTYVYVEARRFARAPIYA
jgi:hypothetical protein